ncbi:MAG: type III secretion inner membrane ring lipoprotein SctJ, partial [Tabrizicola sp.]|nr:type III secretion inner membrane ring lipoprotein SctJ [Tabrizicola sp.]
MPSAQHRIRKLALVTVCCLTLAGCKEVLFSSLEETEANEMVAILASAGVTAHRERDKDNIYSVLVEEEDIPTATTLLRAQGFPRPKFQSLGDVFTSEGIVGTPFEQQVRYIHAMNEELSRTISSISGIKSARVFITAPPKDRYEREAPPASASVTINYEPGFDAESEISKIKTIVAHSVPNLDYDNVAVALFEASGPAVQAKEPAAVDQKVYEARLVPEGWFLLRCGLDLAPDRIALPAGGGGAVPAA